MVGDQIPLASEVDGSLRPYPARVDHALRVRMDADQVPGHLQGWPARGHLCAPLGQQGQQPVPLRVGLLGQLAEVDRQSLRAAHQRAERRPAKRRIRVAFGRGPLQKGDQASVRSQCGLAYRLVCVADRLVRMARYRVCAPAGALGAPRTAAGRCVRPGADPGRQPAGRDEQGLRDRRADLVEGLEGRVDHPRPGGQVLGPSRRPFRRGGVVPVVGGQFQLDQVQERVAAVHLELGEGDLPQVLGRGQVRLVVRVSQPLATVPGRRDPGQPRSDATQGQILRLAVVFMSSAVLTHLSDVEIANRTQPWGKIHAADATARLLLPNTRYSPNQAESAEDRTA